MAASDILIRGENALIRRNLLAEDGETPVPLDSLEYLSVQVIQFRRVLYSFVHTPEPDPVQTEIRQGPAGTNQVEVEITPTVSATFKEGQVTCRIVAEQTAASFATYGKLRDIDYFIAFTAQ
jgi:hypothetical protein